jgi:hypothetical protein
MWEERALTHAAGQGWSDWAGCRAASSSQGCTWSHKQSSRSLPRPQQEGTSPWLLRVGRVVRMRPLLWYKLPPLTAGEDGDAASTVTVRGSAEPLGA